LVSVFVSVLYQNLQTSEIKLKYWWSAGTKQNFISVTGVKLQQIHSLL